MLNPGVVTSRASYIQGWLNPWIVTSRGCYIQGWLNPGVVTSRGCYIQGLLHSGVVTFRSFYIQESKIFCVFFDNHQAFCWLICICIRIGVYRFLQTIKPRKRCEILLILIGHSINMKRTLNYINSIFVIIWPQQLTLTRAPKQLRKETAQISLTGLAS